MADDYKDERHYHRHMCHFCRDSKGEKYYVWRHHDVNDRQHGDGKAHECPRCGHCNWSLGIYTGPLPPETQNGVDPGPAVSSMIHPDQQRDEI